MKAMKPIGQQLSHLTEYDRGWNDASEPMECKHPRACLVADECSACRMMAEMLIESNFERDDLIARIKHAASKVIPQATIDFIDGCEATVEIILKEIDSREPIPVVRVEEETKRVGRPKKTFSYDWNE